MKVHGQDSICTRAFNQVGDQPGRDGNPRPVLPVLPVSNAERLGAKFSLELLPVRHVKEALSRVAGK